MSHYKEGCKSRWSEEDRVLKNLTKINQKKGAHKHYTTHNRTLWKSEVLDPYQKFWCCSIVGSNPVKIRSSRTPLRSSDVVLLLGVTLRKSEVLDPYQKFWCCLLLGATLWNSGVLVPYQKFWCWAQPFESQKFWSHIRTSGFRCNGLFWAGPIYTHPLSI
jgi:hypothetical protein